MGQARDAEPVALGLDGQVALGQAQEGGIVGAARQIARQHGAEPGQGALGFRLGVGHAQPVAGLRLLQGRRDVTVLRRKSRRQPQRRQRVGAAVLPFQRHGQPGQRPRGHPVVGRAEIAVRGHLGDGIGGVAVLGLAGVKRQPGQVGPVRASVVLGHGLGHQPGGAGHVALDLGPAGGLARILPRRGRVHRGQPLRLGQRPGAVRVGQEGRGLGPGAGAGKRVWGWGDDPARQRPREGLRIARRLALGKARAGVLVVGQRLALGIAQAGLNAGLQRGVEDPAQIAARQVGVGRQLDAGGGQGPVLPVLRGGGRGRQDRRGKGKRQKKPSFRHHSPFRASLPARAGPAGGIMRRPARSRNRDGQVRPAGL